MRRSLTFVSQFASLAFRMYGVNSTYCVCIGDADTVVPVATADAVFLLLSVFFSISAPISALANPRDRLETVKTKWDNSTEQR